jgi:hypothetical protein
MSLVPFHPTIFQNKFGNWSWYEPLRGWHQWDSNIVLYYVYGSFPIEALAKKDSDFFVHTRISSAHNRWAVTLEGIHQSRYMGDTSHEAS